MIARFIDKTQVTADKIFSSQGSRFLFVGGLTTLLYFLLFNLFWQGLHWHRSVAVIIAYSLFMLANFNSHRRLTFKAHHQHWSKQIARYGLLVLLNFFLTVLIVQYFTLLIDGHAFASVITASALTTIVSYLLSKYWVYQAP